MIGKAGDILYIIDGRPMWLSKEAAIELGLHHPEDCECCKRSALDWYEEQMIDGDNYCFCMQCPLDDPSAGEGCGRCLDRLEEGSSEDGLHGSCKQRLLEKGIEQAKEGKGKPLSWDLNEDTDWLKDEADVLSRLDDVLQRHKKTFDALAELDKNEGKKHEE